MNQISATYAVAMVIFLQVAMQAPLAAQLENAVESHMSREIEENGPGCAVLVVKDGKQLLSKGFGLANLEHRIPFTPETISDIGSVAKQFTCFAVNLLIERGLIHSVEDPAFNYLTYLPPYARKIRVLDLMMHTSGLREIYSILALQGHRSSDGIKQSDARRLIENSKALNFSPGSEYMYCNTAYMLLADLIEKVTGDSYEDWLDKNVFKPLDMYNTYVMDVQGEVFENTAESYMMDDRGYRRIFDNSTAYGQGGIYASLNDMEKWLDFISHPRDYDWCDRETIENLYSTEDHFFANGKAATYAKGLTVAPYRGINRIGHTGSSAGYRSTLQYFPDFDLGIVIKTNVPSIDYKDLVDLIIGKVLGSEILADELEHTYRPSLRCSFEIADEKELNQFVGTYLSREYSTLFEISLEHGKLVLHHALHESVSLKADSSLSFCVHRSPVNRIDFEMSEGEVAGFNAQGNRIRDVYFEKIE